MEPIRLSLEVGWIAEGDPPRKMEPALFALLEGIQRTGKLTEATERADVSYRYGWEILRRWSGILGEPLVSLERGRGSRLTELGERLLALHMRVEAHLAPALQQASGEIEEELRTLRERDRDQLRLYASHDLVLSQLVDHLRGHTGASLEARFVGSLHGLTALAKGHCDLAGIHVPEGELGKALAASYQGWLDPHHHRLIRFVTRIQGLIVTPGNPLGLAGVSDIAERGARFVNRQRGSGTRLALDRLLEEAGVDPRRIEGYYVEEFTHLAVAAAVAGGMADVGLGEEGAARMLDLDFVPLFRERYYLVLRAEDLADERLVRLRRELAGPNLARLLSGMKGYDGAGAGDVLPAEEALPGSS